MTWAPTYLAIDTETTGFDGGARILELAILTMKGLEMIDSYHQLFWPDGVDWNASGVKGALKVNGLSPDDLRGKPSFRSCADDILTQLRRCRTWVGHNLEFDIRMLTQEFGRLNLDMSKEASGARIDTMVVFRQIHRAPRGHKLGDAAKFFGVVNEAAHTAHDDALTTARVLGRMVETHPKMLPNFIRA